MAYPTVEKINSIFEDHSPLSGIWESSSFFMAVEEWDSMAGVAEVTVGPLLLDEAGRRPLDSPSSSPPNRSLLDLDFSDISAMTIQHHLRFSTIQDPTTGDGLYIWVSKQIKMVFKLEWNQLNFELLCQLSATVSYENIGGYNIEPAATAATIIKGQSGDCFGMRKTRPVHEPLDLMPGIEDDVYTYNWDEQLPLSTVAITAGEIEIPIHLMCPEFVACRIIDDSEEWNTTGSEEKKSVMKALNAKWKASKRKEMNKKEVQTRKKKKK